MTTKQTQAIEIHDIKARDSKRGGVVRPGEARKGHHARILPGEAIVLYGAAERYRFDAETRKSVVVNELYCRRFNVGDLAEYGSYNLSYYGRIVSITAKRVVIEELHVNNPRRHSLDIHQFSWRNYDWTLEQARKRNGSWMD